MRRTHRRIAATLAATALLAATGAGVAQAASAGSGAPSACRPANHLAKITQTASSAGHRHYRVTLTAPKGYASCTLAGSPTGAHFTEHGKSVKLTAQRYGAQSAAVTFGPGHPVHFDIQVPSGAPALAADEVSFTLQAPGGEIPGLSYADGRLRVAKGTKIGPVQRGA
jgi:hypothetical protein